MRSYSVRDVERVLQLSPATTRGLIRAGFVKPARGPRREYRFSFQDLIVLRTARALIEAKIPAKRIRRSLESLRRELPESLPLSGLAISAVGDHVVVRDGEARWQAESGQYLLGLDVTLEDGVLHVVEHKAATPSAPVASAVAVRDWFAQALALEATDPQRRARGLPAVPPSRARQRRRLDQLGTPAARAGQGAGSRRASIERGLAQRGARCAAAVQPRRAARGSRRHRAPRSRPTRARSRRTRISPTAITTSRACTSRWASRSTPSATWASTAACVSSGT